MVVRERILYDRSPCIIDWYGYEVKHIPPDIKHHRIPAPEMSFARPNLTTMIQEIEAVIKKTK